MTEIYLVPTNTIPVASAVTGATEEYIRQALSDDRLTKHMVDGQTLVSIDEVRELLRADNLRT